MANREEPTSFEVTLESGSIAKHAGAKFSVTENSVLLIFSQNGPLVASYAPGKWIRVYETGNVRQ